LTRAPFAFQPANTRIRRFDHHHSHHNHKRFFQTNSAEAKALVDRSTPGSAAFADCEASAVADLFYQFSKKTGVEGQCYLDPDGVRELLTSIGERPDDDMLQDIFQTADVKRKGTINLEEFLKASDKILCGAPARVVLVVGGPGSGKGRLCARLAAECNVVHLSSGDLLRDEVARDTPLGRECASIMARGELVSSAVIVTLLRRRMRAHPGMRVLLDGFPRSIDNALGFVELCGRPELALHLECDDTYLMERILNRGREGGAAARKDDNIDTALKRLRNYHKYHHATMDWLREQHVPVVNLDCSGTPENVWQQLLAIGRLMRPVARLKSDAPDWIKGRWKKN
jgi:adenylate kinase family enzyme